MRLANLWLFFYGSAASTSYAYDGRIPCHSTVSAVCSGPTAVEDSRGFFKRNGQATPAGVRAHARVARAWVEAQAVAAPAGVRRKVACGTVDVIATSSVLGIASSRRRASLGQAGTAGHALALASGARATARSANPGVEASSDVVVQGHFARARVGAGAGVVIGIDEVAAEFEEILLLLEVA